MIDGLFLCVLVAAGAFGWLFCMRNKRVFIVWRWAGWPALFVLIGALLLSAPEVPLQWWSNMHMDRIILGVALAPVLVWPMRKPDDRNFARVTAP